MCESSGQSACPGKLGPCLPSSGVWLPPSSGYGFYICNGLLFATQLEKKKVPRAILCLNNNINFCNVTAQAFIYSLGEVVLFCLCLASAFETPGGIALPWQIQAFCRDFHSLPGSKVLPALGLNSVSCSEKYFAQQPQQDRFLMAGLPRDAHIFLCLLNACLTVVLQQLSED